MRKVCEVYLISSSATDERGVELTFPVSQYEMMDAFEQIHTKSPGDVYWQVDEFYCFDYLAPHLDESMSIFKFNALTEQLSKLDSYQETALEGLLQMQVNKHMQENNGPITTQELMMLAANVNRCQVLADIHTDEDLGKFYVKNGFREDLDALPDSAYALLDYAKIGKQMRESEAGVFTPHGYVVRTEELQPLPDYEPQRDINYMIRLTLMNHENEQRTSVLDLPATEERLLSAEGTRRTGMVRRTVHRLRCHRAAAEYPADRCGRPSKDQRTGAVPSGIEGRRTAYKIQSCGQCDKVRILG